MFAVEFLYEDDARRPSDSWMAPQSALPSGPHSLRVTNRVFAIRFDTAALREGRNFTRLSRSHV